MGVPCELAAKKTKGNTGCKGGPKLAFPLPNAQKKVEVQTDIGKPRNETKGLQPWGPRTKEPSF